MTSGAAPLRCAVHPARRAADACPVCGRQRCDADRAGYGERGCAACAHEAAAGPPPVRELWVRAVLAALAAAYVAGWIGAQYVDTQYFALITPFLGGLVCAWASSASAGALPRNRLLACAAVAAVVGAALADRFVPGGQNLFLPVGDRLPPYVAAVVGAGAWPLLFGPVRRPPSAADDGQGPRGMRRK
jgi:peptidoglycan/LPS O-acetylase OafA/YrhL